MRLGKKPPRSDYRTLCLRSFVRRDRLPTIPPATSYRAKLTNLGAMLNEQIGDCAVAGPGHEIQCWTANVGSMFVPPDQAILEAYSAISGYDPRTGAHDDGCVMLDVLNYWRSKGIAGRRLGAYAAVQPGDHAEVMEAVYLFDGCLIGLNLPRAVQGLNQWQGPRMAWGPWQAGSWGGHAVPIIDYDANWLYVVTWGKVLQMDWRFFDLYCDEAYVLFSQDWFDATNKAPNGFDWTGLAAELQAMTGAVAPKPPTPPGPPPTPPPTPAPTKTVTVTLQVEGTIAGATIPGFSVVKS